MNEFSLSELLLGAILLLQFALLIIVVVLWRRQNTRDLKALKSTTDYLKTAQGRLENVVHKEMVQNRRDASEQADAMRAQMTVSLDKLSDHLVILERGNQQLSDKLGEGFNAFAQSLIRQLNEHSALTSGETAQLRAELFDVFEGFGSQVGRKINESVSLQEHQFGQLDEKLAALSLDNGAQLKSLNETLGAHLEAIRRENAQSWVAKLGDDSEAARQTRLELREALVRLMDAVVRNFALPGEAQRGQFDAPMALMNAMAQGAEIDERLQEVQSDSAPVGTDAPEG